MYPRNKYLFCYFLIFILTLDHGLGSNTSQAPSKDVSMVISLRGITPTRDNSEIYNSFYTLDHSSSLNVLLTDISPQIKFIVFQVHSYKVGLTLSYSPILSVNNHVNGTNLGLYSDLKPSSNFYILNPSENYNVYTYISVHGYTSNDPIPGGCNMEFNVENAPFLYMSEQSSIITVDAAPARLPTNDECDSVSLGIKHKFYHYYLKKEDLNRDTYFKALKDMMLLENIIENSHSVPQEYGYKQMRRTFSHYANTPSIFVVTATYKNVTSVYVPVFSSGCSDPLVCQTTTALTTLCGIIALCGFVMCFFGHFFFKVTIYMFGTLVGTIGACIAINCFINMPFEVLFTCSFLFGLLCGVLHLGLWKSQGLPFVSISVGLLCLGILVSSIIYFTCPSNYWFQIHDNLFFWPFFASVALLVMIILLPLGHHAYMKSCAVIGAFALVAPLDLYFGSHLRYIFINFIRRSTVDNFDKVNIDAPFQLKDLVLTLIWGGFAVIGFLIQLRINRGKPSFPPPTRPPRPNIVVNTNPVPSAPPLDENTPLLRSYFWNPQNQ